MKKLLTFLSILLMGAVLHSQTIDLEFPEIIDAVPGTQVVVPIYVMASTHTIAAFEVHLDYDNTVLTPVGIQGEHPNFAAGPNWYNNLSYNNHIVYASWTDGTFMGQSIGAGEVLYEVVFDYLGGTSQLNFWMDPKGSYDPEKGSTYFMSGLDGGYAAFAMNFTNGSVTDVGGGTEWTGAASSAWDDGGNWSAGVPADGVDATIPVVVTKAVYPVITVSAVTGALTINTGAMLTVAPGGDLTTNGLFTNDGDFEIETEGSNGFSGSFIDKGGIVGTGTFYFTRNMLCTGTTGSSADPNWHYLSAPIDGFTSDDMYDYYINIWDETTSMWNHLEGDVSIPCDPAPTTSLGGMEAWSINLATDYLPECNVLYPGTGMDIEFMGPVTDMHTGAYSTLATYTAGAFAGWNMFGNPYPSGLNMNTIVWDINAVPGAAYYDGCSGNYVTWSPALGDYSMSPGLGFFTEWTGAGSFDLVGTERDHNPDWFWKSEITDLLTLEVTGNDKSDVTHIRFMDNAEPGFAKDGDFHKLFSTEAPQIYTTTGADKLAINALPATTSVPMGFTSEVSGSYTISAIETSEFENVVLEDTYTGIETDMLKDDYSFDYIEGSDPNRFIVHFTALGTPELEANSIHIWASERNIYVTVPATVTGDVAVYNMMGQEVVANKVIPGMNVIPVNDVNTYYVVKVRSNNIVKTEKVFIR